MSTDIEKINARINIIIQDLQDLQKQLNKESIITEEDKQPTQATILTEQDLLRTKKILPEGYPTEWREISHVYNLLNLKNFDAVCNSKQPFNLRGQIDSIKASGIGKTGRPFPCKIILIDGNMNRIQGTIWSTTLEKKLLPLKHLFVIFTNVYLSRVDPKYNLPDIPSFTTHYNKEHNVWNEQQFAFNSLDDTQVFRFIEKEE